MFSRQNTVRIRSGTGLQYTGSAALPFTPQHILTTPLMPWLFCSTCWDSNRSTPLAHPPPQNHQTTNQEGSANATAKQEDSNRALFPSLAAISHVAPPASKDVNDNYSQPPLPLPPRVISRYEGTADSPLGAEQLQQQQQLSTDSRRRCPSCGIVLLRKNLARHLRDQHQSANQPRQVRGLYCRVVLSRIWCSICGISTSLPTSRDRWGGFTVGLSYQESGAAFVGSALVCQPAETGEGALLLGCPTAQKSGAAFVGSALVCQPAETGEGALLLGCPTAQKSGAVFAWSAPFFTSTDQPGYMYVIWETVLWKKRWNSLVRCKYLNVLKSLSLVLTFFAIHVGTVCADGLFSQAFAIQNKNWYCIFYMKFLTNLPHCESGSSLTITLKILCAL